MYTRCPKCSTCFRVTDKHLAIANGKVRCGQCQTVFNALEHAIDDVPLQELNKPAANAAAPSRAAPTTAASSNTPAKKDDVVFHPAPAPKAEVKPEPKPQSPAPAAKAATPAKPVPPAKTDIKPQPKPTAPATASAPRFSADATIIKDLDELNNAEVEEINLGGSIDSFSSESPLDDDFDLDNAIDDFTRRVEGREEKPAADKKPQNSAPIADSESQNIFDTNNYDATSAASVADIFAEMEQQLALNIEPPAKQTSADNYSADDEFRFLDDEDESEFLLDEPAPPPARPASESKRKKVIEPDPEIDYNDSEFLFAESEILSEKIARVSKKTAPEEEIEFETEDDSDFISTTPSLETDALTNEELDEDDLFDEIDISDFKEPDEHETSHTASSGNLQVNDEFSDSALSAMAQASASTTTKSGPTIGAHDPDEVPLRLRKNLEYVAQEKRKPWKVVVQLLLLLALLMALTAQLAYFRSYELLTLVPQSRPLLEKFCASFACQYSGARDVTQIKLLSRDVRLHPQQKGALLISAAMINNAKFAQPYPDIYIQLSDISGNIVAQRRFTAKEYMGKLSNPFLLMKPGTPVHVNFEVIDPGKDAVNFEFTFR